MEEKYRILIVDDDADVRETLRQILLEIGGTEVECMEDGEAGFSLIQERNFDLVFLDVEG